MTAGIVPTVAGVVAGLHIGAVVFVAVLGAVSGGPVAVDLLRPFPIAVLYAMPAVLALLGLRARQPLLLAAGISALLLALVPFSLHSFVLGPVGLVYTIAYGRLASARSSDGLSGFATVVGCPLVLLGALFALVLHDDPVCYTEHAAGDVTIDRAPGDITSGRHTIPADSDVVASGCTGDTVVWWEALTSLGLSASAGLGGIRLVPRADGGALT